jgi:hypothetical protein
MKFKFYVRNDQNCLQSAKQSLCVKLSNITFVILYNLLTLTHDLLAVVMVTTLASVELITELARSDGIASRQW